ncbi:MAG TPA: hypothetical protein VMG08_18120 [Allosphingosinicella sp.]|nr:hypothetical protein [Allosphingosinicella sp.]
MNAPDLGRHWLAKALAGLLPGLAIAIGVSGLLVWAGPGAPEAPGKYMVAMWAVVLVWMLVLTFCFLFRSGWRAWAWLGGAAILVNAAMVACRAWL